MAEESIYSTLENAPIILAILEVRYIAPKEVTLETLIKLNRHLDKPFPEFQKRYVGNLLLDKVSEETIASINPRVESYIYLSSDKTKTLTLNLKSFNFQFLCEDENPPFG